MRPKNGVLKVVGMPGVVSLASLIVAVVALPESCERRDLTLVEGFPIRSKGSVSARVNRIASACAAALTAVVVQSAAADTLQGRVVRVADGDTITILDDAKVRHSIRLQGIDAPEKWQAFGRRSKENLSQLVFRKVVRAECAKRDRYGRQVCTVWVQPIDCSSCGLTLDACHAQLRQGLAWHFKRYEKEQTVEDRIRYGDAEAEARGSKTGLWADTVPVAPWDLRAEKIRIRR